MTSLCSTCKIETGEKCPRPLCNGAAAFKVEGTENTFECGFCHTQFPKGEGGESHGYCQPCFQKEMDSIPVWAVSQPKENQ